MQTLDSNRHSGETKNPRVFADPDMIAKLQAPRKRDVHVRADDNAFADFRAEHFEQCDTQARWPRQSILEKDPAHEYSKRFLPTRSTAVKIGIVVNA